MSKFSDETCEALWDLTLDGAHDEECGDSSFDRWYGLCLNTGIDGAEHAIVHEDTQGFVDYETYASAKEARSEFERIEREIASEGEEEARLSMIHDVLTNIPPPYVYEGEARETEKSIAHNKKR